MVSEPPHAVSRILGSSTAAAAARVKVRLVSGEAATYAHTGTAVALIISELPGERAEALFIAKAALVPRRASVFSKLQ
jgi:hypothetical protein